MRTKLRPAATAPQYFHITATAADGANVELEERVYLPVLATARRLVDEAMPHGGGASFEAGPGLAATWTVRDRWGAPAATVALRRQPAA
ncbi:MAG: hypothetical protein AVDCRST_MAG77-4525 [uncultured Chloroflexi bacterium]|uniref:Uncharacterized protein n=1 Tax=uncultured Chloroflexota bacterium TaxID=166587 RepID=A0A6J4JWE5_9CHLR|nr:MAG: hypothetical protein AVDCRST_MAG77-4525 [uncultured Chloroflexota bacterium]